MGLGKFVNPRLWASLKPLGLGQQRPNNYMEIVKAGWENKDRAGYAWRILNEGCCDGCALGTKGMRDWTIEGTHLCNIRLRLLRMNTAPPFEAAEMDDAAGLAKKSATELREMGRIPHPFVRRKGEDSFTRASWDEVLDLIAGRVEEAGADRTAGYLTSRGMTNESYYGVQKAMRALGTNNVDNAARVCHSPSTFGLKKAVGVGATTCSYTDWIGSDLVVFIGSNVANNQPVAMKYLHEAKVEGTKVAMVGPYREPGMERYWVPSNPESAIFGTKITDRFFDIDIGGDIAFFTGTLKHMLENGWEDEEFIDRHTEEFDDVRELCESQDWADLEKSSGASRAEMLAFAEMLRDARTAVFVWSMGVDPALQRRGQRARDHQPRALQGLRRPREVRADAHPWPLRRPGRSGDGRLRQLVPRRRAGERGLGEGDIRAVGLRGPLRPGPDRGRDGRGGRARRARRADLLGRQLPRGASRPRPDPRGPRRIPLRVHMDIVLSPQMFVEPDDTVVILPATTRYEIPGGVTETSTERRIIFSPEVEGPRIDDARSEHWVFGEIVARARPERADDVRFESMAAMRKRDRQGGEGLRRHPAPARGRRLVPVRRADDRRRLELRHRGRQRPLQPSDHAARARGRPPPAAVDPTRQAVQLDGPGASGRAHRSRARSGADLRGRRRPARRRATATGRAAQRPAASSRARC